MMLNPDTWVENVKEVIYDSSSPRNMLNWSAHGNSIAFFVFVEFK